MPPTLPETTADFDPDKVTLAELDFAIMAHRQSSVAMRSMGDWGRAKLIDDKLDQLLEARHRMTGDKV